MPITGKSIDGFPFDFVIKQTFLILFLQKLFEMSSRREHREDKGMIGGVLEEAAGEILQA